MAAERWTYRYQLGNGSWVFSPTEECLKDGRELHKILMSRWNAPAYFYHLQKGGHVAALKSHLDNQFFIHTDIKSFFNTISKTRVIRAIKPYLGYKKAKDIADFSTVRLPGKTDTKHVLPYGFAQSPILASICLHNSKLGGFLQKIASTTGLSVSLYVDDITISSVSKVPLDKVLEGLNKVAIASRFEINTAKTEGPSQKITAFNIDLSHGQISINPERYHAFQTAYTMAEPKSKIRQGIYSYVSSIDDFQARELIKL